MTQISNARLAELALSPVSQTVVRNDVVSAMATKLLALRERTDAMGLAGKHLAVKLAEVYRASNQMPGSCQAIVEWTALMKKDATP